MGKPAITELAPPLTMRTYPDGRVTYDVQLWPDYAALVASLWPYGTQYELHGCGESRIVPSTAAAEIHILRKALTIAARSAATWKAKNDEITSALLDVARQRDQARKESNQP